MTQLKLKHLKIPSAKDRLKNSNAKIGKTVTRNQTSFCTIATLQPDEKRKIVDFSF
jgi:hypothetical protein